MKTTETTESTKTEELVESVLMLKQKDLLNIALSVQKSSVEEDTTVYSKDQIQPLIEEACKKIVEYAEHGYTEMEYDCEKWTKNFTKQFATMFKTQNPEIIVIHNAGTNHLTFDWSGENEV